MNDREQSRNSELFFRVPGDATPTGIPEVLGGLLSTLVGRERAEALLGEVDCYEEVFPSRDAAEDFLLNYPGSNPVCAVKYGEGEDSR